MVFKVSVIVLTFLTSLGTPFLLHAQEEPPSEVVPEQPAPPVDSTVASDVQEPPVVQEFGPQSDAGDMGMMSPMPDMGDQMLMSDPMGQPGSVLEQSAQPVPEKTPEEVAAQREVMSIDTVSVDEPSGNWLFKRIWYEKAEDEYGKLKELSSIVAQERMKFFAERTKLDRELFDPFYKNLGYGMGELQEMLTTIIENMEQERALSSFSSCAIPSNACHACFSYSCARLICSSNFSSASSSALSNFVIPASVICNCSKSF